MEPGQPPPSRPNGLFGAATEISSQWLLLALLIALAAALRIPSLTLNSFWLDEVYTAAIALNPFMESIRGIVVDVHPPLFYMAISAWSLVFGDSEIALRAFSATVGIATIPILYLLLRAPLGTRVAFGFAALTAVLPSHIYYSQEIRSYGMTFLTATIAIALLLKFLATPSNRNKWLLAVSCGILFLCHYISMLLIGAIALAIFVGIDDRRHNRFKTFFNASVAIALFIVPLSGHMLYKRLSSGAFWASPMEINKALDVIFELTHYNILLGVFLYLLCAIALFRAIRSTNPDTRRYTAAVATVAFVPVSIGFVAAFLSPGFNVLLPRTMLVLGPGIILLAAMGLAGFRRIATTATLLLVFALGSAYWLYSTSYYSVATKSDFRGISKEIARLEQQATSILVILDSDWFCSPIGELSCGRSQYYFRIYGVSSPPVTPNRREDPGHVVSQLVEMARQQGATQLILASFNEPELEKLYLRIKQQFDMISLKTFTGSVPGYEVTIDPNNVPAFSFVATFRIPVIAENPVPTDSGGQPGTTP